MHKGWSLVFGLMVGSLVMNTYPTEFASVQQSASLTLNDFLPIPIDDFISNENESDMEERVRIYEDRGSEERQKRRKRLYDLSTMGYSGGRSRSYVSHLEVEQALRLMIPMRREFGDRRGEISDFMRIASTYALRMRHREAVEHLKIAIELARSTDDLRMEYQVLTKLIAATDLFEGSNVAIYVYEYLIRRDSSFDWIPARLEYLNKKLKLPSLEPYLFEKIGNSYSTRKEYPKAIEAYKKSVSGIYNNLLKKTDKNYFFYEYKSIAEIQLKMGLLYKLMKKKTEADNALNNSLDSYSKFGINREYDNLLTTESIIESRIAELEIWEGLTTLAIAKNSDQLILKVIQAQINRYNKKYFIFKVIGDAYNRVGEYKAAINYYEKALKYRLEMKTSTIPEDYKSSPELALAKAYANIGDKSTSLKYYLLIYNNYYLRRKRPRFFSSKEQKYREERYTIIGKRPTDLADGFGSVLLVKIGNFYKNLGDTDKALNLYKQAADKLDYSEFEYGGWGGSSPQASILSDEDDIGKLITESSKEDKTETTNQDSKK